MMKEDLGVSKAQAWGCSRNPQEIFKETQASKLGDAPMHPLLHQQSSVHPPSHYIFITSCVMCYAWSVSLLGMKNQNMKTKESSRKKLKKKLKLLLKTNTKTKNKHGSSYEKIKN